MLNKFEDPTMEDFVLAESKASFDKLITNQRLMEVLKNTHFESFFDRGRGHIDSGPFQKSLGFIESIEKLRNWLTDHYIGDEYKDGVIEIKNQNFGKDKNFSVKITVLRNHENINTSHPHVEISSNEGNYNFILFPEFSLS
jgi:hypothetical protein